MDGLVIRLVIPAGHVKPRTTVSLLPFVLDGLVGRLQHTAPPYLIHLLT